MRRPGTCNFWIERKDGQPLMDGVERLNIPMYGSFTMDKQTSAQCLEEHSEEILEMVCTKYDWLKEDLDIKHGAV